MLTQRFKKYFVTRFTLTTAALLVAATLFAQTQAYSENLVDTANCVREGYGPLVTRHGIVAAVLSSSDVQILTFGTGTEDQIFEIGSVTKTFTANLLAQEILANNINLSDPIPSEFQKSEGLITYQHLTTHTSGIIGGLFPKFPIQNPLAPYEGLNVEVFKSQYAQTPLNFSPGASWEYSNIGVSLLGLILSQTAKKSYAEMVQERIFKPLQMNDTYFEVSIEASSRFKHGYMRDGSEPLQDMPPWDLFKTAINPAGGIRSTIHDMVKYARANLRPENLPLSEGNILGQAISLSHKPLYFVEKQKNWMAMNWIHEPALDLFWHNGSTYGFGSMVAFSKKKGLAIVALSDTTVIGTDESGHKYVDFSLERIALKCLK